MFSIITTIIIHLANFYTFLEIQHGYSLFWSSFPDLPDQIMHHSCEPQRPCASLSYPAG